LQDLLAGAVLRAGFERGSFGSVVLCLAFRLLSDERFLRGVQAPSLHFARTDQRSDQHSRPTRDPQSWYHGADGRIDLPSAVI
jgi:hypothetical protein